MKSVQKDRLDSPLMNAELTETLASLPVAEFQVSGANTSPMPGNPQSFVPMIPKISVNDMKHRWLTPV
jgi:hypothetical protein